VDVAFVANPGDWMLHCHILEHQSGGMTSVIRIA
jgi:FtsP/CotA-like multicopper oxidase with cupredoxin domain